MSEEVLSRHRKELKALEGEKRAAIKKLKGTKGKKGKELIQTTEKEYDDKAIQLKEKHKQELASTTELNTDINGEEKKVEASADITSSNNDTAQSTSVNDNNDDTNDQEDKDLSEKERKMAKARKKREKAKQAERDRIARIEQETKDAGPSARQMELDLLKEQLDPLQLQIAEIPSDGHCLYRAIAAQLNTPNVDYMSIRDLCSKSLMKNETEFAPFCEFTDKIQSYNDYVNNVRSSSDWGGHLELRALQMELQRPIVVYKANQGESPLILGNEEDCDNNNNNDDEKRTIRLSYHLHYYSLGEHYNHVVPNK